MEINKKLRAAKYEYIALSILSCILGIWVIIKPEVSFGGLCIFGGIFLFLLGCVKIAGFLSKDLYQLAFQFDLAAGIIAVILGFTFIFKKSFKVTTVFIIFGLIILVDSVLKVQTAIEAKSFGIPKWWLILCFAIVTSILGLNLMLQSFVSYPRLLIQLGVAMIGEGILNSTTVLTAVNIIQKKRIK